jgi:hypothetical protein
MEQMIDPQIAPNLKTLFPNEEVDFAVKAKRKIPIPFGIFRLITSLFILTIVLAFGGTIVGGILTPGKIDDGPGKYFVIGFFGLFFFIVKNA